MSTLGGNVCIRNGNDLDFCWRECVQSLLPVCDEVVVCDGESTDGTQEAIREWMEREPKIKLCVYPWPDPVGDIDFWVKWLNFAREHVSCDYHIQLDADEVLSEDSYAGVRAHLDGTRHSVFFRRYNFWQDHHHLIPHGVCLSHRVCRLAPQWVWLPSDGPHPRGHEAISMAIESDLEIFHYGYLRKPSALFKEKRELHKMFFNNYDSRLENVENKPGNWMKEIKGIEWLDRLIPFSGKHPVLMYQWLRERGYDINV